MGKNQMTEWWKTGIVYQIYPRSFMDASGDGVGDLRGIADRLDHCVWLGIDAIWLSPIYRSPMADFGYDVADYRDIDPLFGTLADFDHLLAAAHERGLRVILDWVPNHTSDQHEWFVEARSSRENPKRDWYIWADPKPDGSAPNNWLSYFGGPAWTFDEATGQYYLHNFAPEQPELNYRNPAVKDAMFAELRFWLDRGVDGFRIDVVDRLLKDPALRDNPPNPNYIAGRDSPTEALSRVHSEYAPGTLDVIREFRAVIKSYPDRVMIGEIAYSLDLDFITAFYGDHEDDVMDLPFNFGLILTEWGGQQIRDYVNTYEEALPRHGWPNYVLGNHDMHRIATRAGGQAGARLAALLLLTLRGTPFIYYGDEIGMENVAIPDDRVQDPFGRNVPGFTRDVARTPMQWSSAANAGFTQATPWLPLADDFATVNVAAQRDDPTAMLTLYHRLIAYRRDNPALTLGTYTEVDYPPDGVFAYLRQHDGQRRLIVLNFQNTDKQVAIAGMHDGGQIALSTYLDRAEAVDLSGFTLRPHEGVLIEI